MSKKYITDFRGEEFSTPLSCTKMFIKDEPRTPGDEYQEYDLDYPLGNEYCDIKRKSMSMDDISSLRGHFNGLELDGDRRSRYTNHFELPTRELSRTKFVSMAEAIYHYQRDTPGRFHSSRPKVFEPQAYHGPTGLTVAQSPMLRCKARSRTVHVMSQKEKEEMELEEIRKHKIKAHPIPKSVIEGSKNLPEVPKRAVTVPEPFNLTELPKKECPSPEVQKFKARPAPKHILEKPHIPVKPPIQVTRPISPKLSYRRSNSQDCLLNHVRNDKNFAKPKPKDKPVEKVVPRLGPVKPEPFSFEKRDEELKRRREERIKQQIDEERKMAVQFKAQPLPGNIKKRMHQITAVKGSGCSNASSENKENHIKAFEARPATVLYKEPFKPIMQQIQPVKQKPFALTTEKRAAERATFDKKLKEKEEEQERLRLEREKELRDMEEKANAELRAKLVHHPKPVPVGSPFVPEKSNIPMTVPETPKFVRRLKQH